MRTKDVTAACNVYAVRNSFSVLQTADLLQTAVMRLEPGAASGPLGNEHAQSEQVLFVVEGEVMAEIGDRKFPMQAGECVVVPRNVPHRFRNESTKTALTYNVYSPPAY